jgi:hypothetical protein
MTIPDRSIDYHLRTMTDYLTMKKGTFDTVKTKMTMMTVVAGDDDNVLIQLIVFECVATLYGKL